MFYFGIDVETTGQFLTKNAMIEFSCSVMDKESKEIDNFTAYLDIPKERGWEKRCVDEFWSIQEEKLNFIMKNIKDHKNEMNRFVDWLDKIDLKYGNDLVILSDNGGYDYAWINTYISNYTDRPSIYYRLKEINKQTNEKEYCYRRTWDTNSVYHGGLVLLRPNEHIEWNLEDEIGIQNKEWKNDHNSLNDARNIVCNYISYLNKAKNMIKK